VVGLEAQGELLEPTVQAFARAGGRLEELPDLVHQAVQLSARVLVEGRGVAELPMQVVEKFAQSASFRHG
jgi:hypothetical protein